LIDAFRAFEIPERMQAEFGYPPLTRATKEQILSTNARALYDLADDAVHAVDEQRDRAWVANASRELTAAIARAGSGTG
jgi:hypothetical protein